MTTGPATTPAGEDDAAPRGKELYQSGPWLVVFGHGTDSEARAHQVCDLCRARGVHFDLVAVDEVTGLNPSHYTALIVIMPSTPPEGQPTSSVAKIVEVIKAYRARRPHGLASLLGGSKWYKVGVVQVFCTHDAHDHARLQSITNRICLIHHVDDGPIDPFAVYEAHGQPASPRSESSDHLDYKIRSLWAYLRSWGLANPQDFSTARELIEDCCHRYEDPRFPALHRPIQGNNRNRLDLLLDEHETRAPGHKKWMENGARVARYVFKELKRQFPDFHRPNGRDGKKDAQKDLRQLYRALYTFGEVSKVMDQRSRRS